MTDKWINKHVVAHDVGDDVLGLVGVDGAVDHVDGLVDVLVVGVGDWRSLFFDDGDNFLDWFDHGNDWHLSSGNVAGSWDPLWGWNLNDLAWVCGLDISDLSIFQGVDVLGQIVHVDDHWVDEFGDVVAVGLVWHVLQLVQEWSKMVDVVVGDWVVDYVSFHGVDEVVDVENTFSSVVSVNIFANVVDSDGGVGPCSWKVSSVGAVDSVKNEVGESWGEDGVSIFSVEDDSFAVLGVEGAAQVSVWSVDVDNAGFWVVHSIVV